MDCLTAENLVDCFFIAQQSSPKKKFTKKRVPVQLIAREHDTQSMSEIKQRVNSATSHTLQWMKYRMHVDLLRMEEDHGYKTALLLTSSVIY